MPSALERASTASGLATGFLLAAATVLASGAACAAPADTAPPRR